MEVLALNKNTKILNKENYAGKSMTKNEIEQQMYNDVNHGFMCGSFVIRGMTKPEYNLFLSSFYNKYGIEEEDKLIRKVTQQ